MIIGLTSRGIASTLDEGLDKSAAFTPCGSSQ